MSKVKIVVHVPVTHSDRVRKAIGDAGGGKIGNYSHCSYSLIRTGRFKPEDGAHPTIGSVGEFESVEEERIEFSCDLSLAKSVIKAIVDVHPYEEPTFDVYQLIDIENL